MSLKLFELLIFKRKDDTELHDQFFRNADKTRLAHQSSDDGDLDKTRLKNLISFYSIFLGNFASFDQ